MKYGETFRGNKDQDVIGVYVDLIDGKVFYSKNGEVFKTAFSGLDLLMGDFYAACCCLTELESFELVMPRAEDWDGFNFINEKVLK